MARYNLFHRIHKGLRASLYDTSMLLQRTEFTIEEEAEDAMDRLQFIIALFERYQHSEDVYVLPAIADYEPNIADSFEQDHEEAYQLGKKLESLMEGFNSLSLPIERIAVSNKIVSQFEEFTLFHIQHMTREEQYITKMLWRYYTDVELQKIGWKIVCETEAFSASYTPWMLRGLNNNEIVRWLKEVKNTAKDDDYRRLLKTAEAELQPQRWHLLEGVLTEGAFMA